MTGRGTEPIDARGSDRASRDSWLGGGISELWRWRPSFIRGEDLQSAWSRVLGPDPPAWSPPTLQIYMHVPYCSRRCGYCMYWSNKLQHPSELEQYVQQMDRRLVRWSSVMGRRRASTAYWGGGSPSLLAPAQLERLLEAFGRAFQVDHLFTFEANPNSLTEDKLRLLCRHGVTRLSLGIQSFDPQVLAAIDRHNPPVERVAALVGQARALGLLVNADLVFGLPGQSQASFRRDMLQLARLRPDTINLYRYQAGVPQQRSAELAGSPIAYHQALGRAPALLWSLLRQGYLFAWPRRQADTEDSHILSRPSAPVRRAALSQLAELVAGRDQSTFYDCFDDSYTHLIGLGPGAYSHLHGFGWYREVSAPTALAAGGEPVFYGSRLGADEEAASFLVQRLSRGRRITESGLRRRFGATVSQALLDRVGQAVHAGVLDRRFGHLTMRPGAPARARERFVQSLMPGQPEEPRDLLALALEGGIDLERDVSLELLHHSALPTGRPLALWAWARLLDLGRVGARFHRSTVERIDGRTIELRLPGDETRLTLLVRWAVDGQRCFGRSRRFALTWHTRSPQALPEGHRDLLEALLDQTQRLDP